MSPAGRGLAAADRCALLARSRRVAVVGASPDPDRPSHRIFTFLRAHPQIDAAPVNPEAAAVDGVVAYPTLAAYAAAHGAPDIVDVFRRPTEAAQVARDAIAVGARAIWFQLGVARDEAVALAAAGGLAVVVDCCIKVESNRCDAERGAALNPELPRLRHRKIIKKPARAGFFMCERLQNVVRKRLISRSWIGYNDGT